MPVTKQYLRYEAASSFGVVCSRKAGAILLEKSGKEDDQRRKGTQLVLAPALEHVIMWDMKTSQKVSDQEKLLHLHVHIMVAIFLFN